MQQTGFEPTPPGWKPGMLKPLNTTAAFVPPDGLEPPPPVCKTGTLPLRQGGVFEQVDGIEPTSSGWKPDIMPLYDTCICRGVGIRTRILPPMWATLVPTPSAAAPCKPLRCVSFYAHASSGAYGTRTRTARMRTEHASHCHQGPRSEGAEQVSSPCRIATTTRRFLSANLLG